MKPFWFAFNVTDWLSSKSVRMMSLAERGAYIGLLATAWGEEVPGTLPMAEDTVRRLAEMSAAEWAASGTALLAEFPVSTCGTYRYNPRLLAEGQEQRRKSELAAEAGRRSAESKKQRKGNGKPTGVAAQPTDVEKTATECQLVTDTITLPSDDGNTGEATPSTADLKNQKASQATTPANPARAYSQATADESEEVGWQASPLTKPYPFQTICEANGFLTIDFEHYRLQALDAARAESPPRTRTVPQWRSWVRKYLNHEKRGGPLLLPGESQRAAPDPEAERLRLASATPQPAPVAGYVPFVSKPNAPAVSEPQPAYGPASTAQRF